MKVSLSGAKNLSIMHNNIEIYGIDPLLPFNISFSFVMILGHRESGSTLGEV